MRHNIAGNGKCEGRKEMAMKQWVISSQASWKQVEGPETRQSNLTLEEEWRNVHECGAIDFL
jgi:hypothetical protein